MKLTLLAALLTLSVSLTAKADGASASGYAWGDFQIGCSTCPHFLIPLSGTPEQAAGGTGFALAAVSYSGTGQSTPELDDYTLAGGAAFAAMAGFEGPLSTPVLGARASTDNAWAYIAADPDVPVGIDLYQASATARTVRQYSYLGSAPALYTFNFQVDGTVGNAQSSAFASAAIYDGSDPMYFETGLIDFGSAYPAGVGFANVPVPFVESFSVSVTVQPGGSFYLIGNLSALAAMSYDPNDVQVDAYNTLRVTSVTGGDTALLLAGPVPEPGTALLLALGLLALAKRARARPAG